MTNFPIITTKQTDMAGFILFWKRLYDYNPELTRSHYLEVISKVEHDKEDLKKLYKWKNGRELSVKKKQGVEKKILPFVDKINEFKHREESDFNQIKEAFPNVTAIWLIFLAHTINKEAFPIFDQHVYRAMHFLETREASELTSYSNPIKISIYQERYLPFYRQYRDQAKSYKDWNEALWAFGKFFRQYKNVFLSQGLTF